MAPKKFVPIMKLSLILLLMLVSRTTFVLMKILRMIDIPLEEVKRLLPVENYSCLEDESVCMYKDICYNIDSQTWETEYEVFLNTTEGPLLNNMGLHKKKNAMNDKDLTEYFKNPDAKLEHSLHCQESFKPVKIVSRPTSAMTVPGITYFLCCFYTHYGHTLLQMIVPAFHALGNLGAVNKSMRMEEVKFLLYEADSSVDLSSTSGNVIRAMSNGKETDKSNENFMDFTSLVQNAKDEKKTHVCFENLISGMRDDNLLGGIDGLTGSIHNGKERGMFQAMEEYMSHFHSNSTDKDLLEALYDASFEKDSVTKEKFFSKQGKIEHNGCTVTILDRTKRARRFSDRDKLIKFTHRAFGFGKCRLQLVQFDNASLKSQYAIMRNTDLFIAGSGTGSHNALFLPDGAVLMEVGLTINKKLCDYADRLHCLFVQKLATEDNSFNAEVSVDEGYFHVALTQARKILEQRAERANSVTIE